MSSRDTSDLYTGATSVTTDRLPTPRQVQAEKKEQDYAKLKPAAEVVLELIARERESILDLRSFVIDNQTPEEEVKSELLSRKKFLDKLNAFEASVKNTLARKPTKRTKLEPTDE